MNRKGIQGCLLNEIYKMNNKIFKNKVITTNNSLRVLLNLFIASSQFKAHKNHQMKIYKTV
jgi:hypothetical protein